MNSNVLFKDDVNNIKEYLKIHPKDINIVVNNITPLMEAVNKERVDVIDCLTEHGCDINYQTNNGWTALHHVCSTKNINREIIERLIANGASGLLKNAWGETPLHRAAAFANDVNVIYQLLFVSDPNSLNDKGENPLMKACWYNKNIKIISALINVTHDINLQDTRGRTALHACCYWYLKEKEAVRLLLSSGADISIKDNYGHTAYDIVDEKGKRIIDEYLPSRK